MKTPEDEFTAASATGDLARIDAASAAIDRLDVAKEPPTLLGAALWYAERGIPVFALIPGRKLPFGLCAETCKEIPGERAKCPGPHECGHDQCHGVLDANTDADRLRRWWTAKPNANVGLATGHRFDAVDVDGPIGQKSRASHWDDIFARIDTDSVAKVLTPRPGGMHIYVPPTGQPNSTNIVTAVDYRGLGGYVLAPPSVIAPGTADSPGTYRFLGTPNLTAPGEVA